MDNEALQVMEDRRKALKKVQRLLSASDSLQLLPRGLRTPKMFNAMLVASPCVLVGLLFPSFLLFIACVIVALIAGTVMYRVTPAGSWDDRLCKILVNYQPVNEQAFRALLVEMEAGTADRVSIYAWLKTESSCVERSPAKAALLAKHLPK